MTHALVELRVLDGPNLYFPRPAIKLTLDVAGLLGLPEERATAAAARVGLSGVPGRPGTEQRRRFATRLLARLVREVAAAAGVRALAVRSRPWLPPVMNTPVARSTSSAGPGASACSRVEGRSGRTSEGRHRRA